ncbi:MAG: alpha-amylase family protein, partial [Saprospiraceae bacterium]
MKKLKQLNEIILKNDLDIAGKDNEFYVRFIANMEALVSHYQTIYGQSESAQLNLNILIQTIIDGWKKRNDTLRKRDDEKWGEISWYLDHQICGMSLYVDRFCGDLKSLKGKLDYFEELGVNFLHLMPLMQSPEQESDGGYAVSDYRTVAEKFGTIEDLKSLQSTMNQKGMYLMLDIVVNHTSHLHEWAQNAKKGDQKYQEYFYMYDDRNVPDQYEASMPEIFPHSSPGNFTWSEECNKWVMTVFNHHQWDLNYTNPAVFVSMLDTVLYYANLGVDILRVDAPAFIWKQLGTSCQNLPEAHTLLQLWRVCVDIAAPGMAILGEAIVSPQNIIPYFGLERQKGKECQIAYNPTQMALQWDALATGETNVMLHSQATLQQKPDDCTWITYTRCHDDIGLGFDDEAIRDAGFNPYEHRRFLKNYYSGEYHGSVSKGALFAVNPKTQDARISGTLASLCGLEDAINKKDKEQIQISIQKIILMQAHAIFLGGIPMLFYGDELGYTNDYSFESDPAKSDDNRWMHRPVIDWKKVKLTTKVNTIENQIFLSTKRLLNLRKCHDVMSDLNNTHW